MSSLAKDRLMTEADLMALPSDARIEIVNGEPVEMSPVGGLHHLIAGNIFDLLRQHVRKNNLGLVFMDGLIYLLERENTGIIGAKVPDVSFIRKADIPAAWEIERPFPGAPTLAVEVVSPGDSMTEMIEKVKAYFKAGTEQVWIVFPRQKELYQYRAADSETVRIYRENDSLMYLETMLPDFSLPLTAIFDLSELD